MTDTWQQSLSPASYGGIPFGVNGARTRAGRQNVVHVYPYRDDVWVEDQGKRARQFQINGFLIEDSLVYGGGSVISQRESLLAICETPGTKTLIHPTFGVISKVNCLEIEISERKDMGRVFEFSMTLLISGERQFPGTAQSTGDVLTQTSNDLKTCSKADFENAAAATVQYGAPVVNQASATGLDFFNTVIGAVNTVNRVFNAISTLSGEFGRFFGSANSGFSGANLKSDQSATVESLLFANVAAAAAVKAAGQTFTAAAGNVADTESYGTAAVALIATAVATLSPQDALSSLAAMSTFVGTASPTTSAVGQAVGQINTASSVYLRRLVIAAMGQVVSTYQPSSQDDAQSVMSKVVGIIDAETLTAADSGDDASYLALRSLRSAVVADLEARGASLAAIATFSFNQSLPALALANRIYRDPTRAAQLIQQVDPIHPAFMPTSFDALAK